MKDVRMIEFYRAKPLVPNTISFNVEITIE